jgi:hypothetical protein
MGSRLEDGERAAQMRADRVGWQKIADHFGMKSAANAFYIAKRFGDPQIIAKWPPRYYRTSRVQLVKPQELPDGRETEPAGGESERIGAEGASVGGAGRC